jgi:hypothetical protein
LPVGITEPVLSARGSTSRSSMSRGYLNRSRN